MLQTTMVLNVNKIRTDFPILQKKINGKNLVYLDNAATAQKPSQVIKAITDFYENYNANIHRSIHQLGEDSTRLYEEAHKKTSDFINAGFEELIFTKSTTESLNLLAYSLANKINKGDEIVVTEMEHHSNFVPWQQLAKRNKATFKVIKVDKDGLLDEESIKQNITSKTKIVSLTHISNVLGTINDISKITKIAHESDALCVVDAAQSVPHMEVDVKRLGCDFLAFSGHKMLGPTGIGALYGKKEHLESMDPFLYGGEMIKDVTINDSQWNDLPWKFEAGTGNIAQAIGLGAAIDYLKKVGMENIMQHSTDITNYAYEKISLINDVKIYGPKPKNRANLISFNVKGVHAHDTSAILDGEGVAVRAGHHCAMPLSKVLGVDATARASFYLYNTKEEVDTLVSAIEKVKRVFT
ncbi:cysteine desulfurase [Candidatus Woesearchaeota archaeon]|nr:cysteine desulfurase [Candidatus Woesearchaeota archaeon]